MYKRNKTLESEVGQQRLLMIYYLAQLAQVDGDLIYGEIIEDFLVTLSKIDNKIMTLLVWTDVFVFCPNVAVIISPVRPVDEYVAC